MTTIKPTAEGKYEIYQPNLNGKTLQIAIIQSRFHLSLTEKLRESCAKELHNLGVLPKNILTITVPGALEIALAAQRLVNTGQFDALIALGVVIRGDTYHFDVVANESVRAISSLATECDIAVANGILTLENETQAASRVSTKGVECAKVAVEMANLLNSLDGLD